MHWQRFFRLDALTEKIAREMFHAAALGRAPNPAEQIPLLLKSMSVQSVHSVQQRN